MALIIFLFITFFLQGVLANEIKCEELPVGQCSFAIASSRNRCLLETSISNEKNVVLQCQTSNVQVNNMAGLIETDECVRACGVDRMSAGISSDLLLDPQFTSYLCLPACYRNCPNIIDLYYNLAIGEGVFLPDLCKVNRNILPRRAMSQVLSSGLASGPSSSSVASSMSAKAAAPMSSESSESDIACSPTSI